MRYRKPAQEVVAVQWFKNGDHPDDHVNGVAVDPADGSKYTRIEGQIVRFFRLPNHPGDEVHAVCGRTWNDHGWIDQDEEVTVCPGNWVVSYLDTNGRFTHHEALTAAEFQAAGFKEAYPDRSRHYVPPKLLLDGRQQFAEVAPPARWLSHDEAMEALDTASGLLFQFTGALADPSGEVSGKLVDAARDWQRSYLTAAERTFPAKRARVALGGADESNGGEAVYWWWADFADEEGPHWSHFEGHRVQVDIEFHTFNHHEVNSWKGRDVVRATGEWVLHLNRQRMWEGFIGSDPAANLRKIEQVLAKLLNHSALDHTDSTPYAEQLVGRRVWWRDTAAVVDHAVLSRGCVVLVPVGVEKFPPAAWQRADAHDDSEDDHVLVELDSEHIWWWRDPIEGEDAWLTAREQQRRNEEAAATTAKVEAQPSGERVEITVEDEPDIDGADAPGATERGF